MTAITREFRLYTNAGLSIPPVIHVNQYDQGETWNFKLYQPNGQQFIPTDAAIVGVKADGNIIANAGTVSGGVVVITETEQMTAAPGKAVFEILFDGDTHGTANFVVLVEPSPTNDGIASESDLSLFQEAIDSISPATINAAVSAWMSAQLTPSEWVIDNSLTVANAAADAKKAGDLIRQNTADIGDLTDLVTEDQSSLVGAINETRTDLYNWFTDDIEKVKYIYEGSGSDADIYEVRRLEWDAANDADITGLKVITRKEGTSTDTSKFFVDGNELMEYVIGDTSDLSGTITEEISDLKSAINGDSSINYVVGKNINATGELEDNATKCVSEKIPYTWTGSTRYYNGTTDASCRIAFYASDDTLLGSFQSGTSQEYRSINAENNVTGTIAYVRFSFLLNYNAKATDNSSSATPVYWAAQSTQSGGLISDVSELQSDVSDISANVSDINEYLDEAFTNESTEDVGTDATWTEGYVTKTGTVNSSDTYHYLTIAVDEGDVIKFGDTSGARYVTALVDGVADASLGAEFSSNYTVPVGVASIIVTQRNAYTSVYRTQYEREDDVVGRIKALEDAEAQTEGYPTITKVSSASLSNGTLTALTDVDTRKNMDIDFRADITSFTSVTVGHGYMINYGAWAVVDSTNVTIYANQNGDQIAQYAHGLTIDHYIHVLIQQGDNTKATLVIETASGRFRQENVSFDSRRGNFYATVNGTFTNVSLTTVLKDLNKDVWMFGDSYQSIGDPKRYPYYLAQDGYINNCLMSGFPGANAGHQLTSFRKLITLGKPKYVVWCLGMNGSDSESAINATWQTCTDEVISTCESLGVIPILATIPNVPDRIQTFKDAYVKATGKRYIDFARAVGAESVGSTWYTGMLSSDNLHPSETGAMALYAELLADFPEIMESK